MSHELNNGDVAGIQFGSFFALMPGDNASTIAANAPVEFPQGGTHSVSAWLVIKRLA